MNETPVTPSTKEPGSAALGSIRTFHTIIRGHAFASLPPDAQRLAVGTPVRFIPEPDNPADAFAVAVWTSTDQPWRLGYLDRSVAAWLAPRIAGATPVAGRVVGWVAEPAGRWSRPLVRVVGDDTRAATPMRTSSWDRRPSIAAEAPGLWGRRPGAARRTVA